MAQRQLLPAHKLVDGESLGSSFDSDPVTVNAANRVGFNISTADVTSGTGTFDIQHRVYKDVNSYSDWATLTLDSTPTMAGADAQFLVDVSVPPGQLRVKYTASGTPDGTCDVWISGVEG
jgi:hypothetical protein